MERNNIMKNIHVLPTEKPSRLCKDELGTFHITESMISKVSFFKNQNIYITSDEEIKEGDWYLTTENTIHKKGNSKKSMYVGGNPGVNKKVILTTDQDLIKDGVQPIDDEFLEWFVKNPIGALVKIDSYKSNYNKWIYKIIIPQEEPKQETIEEAAEKYLLNYFGNSNNTLNHQQVYRGFEQGAKSYAARDYWFKEFKQDKNKYSEEDMRLAINKARNISDGKNCFDVEDISGCTEVCTYGWKFNMSENSIIEQFKKK